MESIDYRNEYQKLRERFTGLPTYETFNEYMEVSFLTYDIYDNALISRFFRRMADRRLESYIGFLQNLLHPTQQMMILIEESQSLSDQQKEGCTQLLKKAMTLYRTCSLLNYSFDEKKECEKITEIIAFFEETQPFIDKMLDHLKAVWEKIEDTTKSSGSYFG